jgi:hypothetical protein
LVLQFQQSFRASKNLFIIVVITHIVIASQFFPQQKLFSVYLLAKYIDIMQSNYRISWIVFALVVFSLREIKSWNEEKTLSRQKRQCKSQILILKWSLILQR